MANAVIYNRYFFSGKKDLFPPGFRSAAGRWPSAFNFLWGIASAEENCFTQCHSWSEQPIQWLIHIEDKWIPSPSCRATLKAHPSSRALWSHLNEAFVRLLRFSLSPIPSPTCWSPKHSLHIYLHLSVCFLQHCNLQHSSPCTWSAGATSCSQ